jgi:hypothetical protein
METPKMTFYNHKREHIANAKKGARTNKTDKFYIRPNAFYNHGPLGIPLVSGNKYLASVAYNQPNYEERGLVFVTVRGKGNTWDEYLLDNTEYSLLRSERQSKPTQVEILKKRHSVTGNPVYDLFIQDHNEKIYGLRKLKAYGMYSLSSYSLRSDLEHFLKTKIKSNTIS